MTKTCSGCNREKSLDAFHRQASSKDGRKKRCKECRKPETSAYYQANKERIDAYNRAWHEAHAEEERERKRRDHEKNREKRRGQSRQWRLANPERKRELTRLSDARDPERVRARQRRWWQSHPEYAVEQNHLRRAVRHESEDCRERTAQLRTEPCTYCGATENIQVDHVVPLSRGGKHVVKNIAPACRTCNASKGSKLLEEWAGPPVPLAA